jgi:hypothetical protein
MDQLELCVWVVPVSNYRLETGDRAIGKPRRVSHDRHFPYPFRLIIHSRFAIRCYITCAFVEVSLNNSWLNAVLHPFSYLLINSIFWFIKDVQFMWTRPALLKPCGTLFVHNVREYTELLPPSNWLCTWSLQDWKTISFVVLVSRLFLRCASVAGMHGLLMPWNSPLLARDKLMLQAVSTRAWRISCTALVNPHSNTLYLILLICICCTVLVQICMLVFSDPETLSSIQM